MRERRRRPSAGAPSPLAVVLLCFLLSGFAALLYETVWTRQFAFVFGTSELAVATVLAAYMGGLAAGAAVAGRLVAAVRRPVLVYGLLELGIALAALAVPAAIRASTALAVVLFGGRPAPPAAEGLSLALFYLACSFVILLVPTGLMGATLPLLARHAVRREQDVGARIGLLYAVNTVGAVLGTIATAFMLLPWLGLRATVLVGVAVNGLVFALAALLDRAAPAPGDAAAPVEERRAHAVGEPPAARPRSAAAASAPAERHALVLPLILVSGVVSFTYEVLWTRLLGHVLGGSVYAFATMLASFLAGIALGSAVAARLATTRARAVLGFGVAQLGVAALSWLAFLWLDGVPALAVQLGAKSGTSVAQGAVLAALVLLPGALCIGATYPFAVRVLARDRADAARASARVYAWNTTGAIVGAIGSGFFLIPLLGYAGMARAAIAVSLALAGATAWLEPPPRKRLAAAAAFGLAVLLLLPPTTPWRLVGTAPLALRRTPVKPLHFAVGRSASVGITFENGVYRIRINGLPEGSVLPAYQNQPSVLERWLGALPSLARPEARSMLVIGLGAGAGLEAIPTTIETIDVIELEPEVITANRLLGPRRAVDPLADRRIRLHTNDARGALVLTEARYDAIVSQPSHPWTAGAAHLYTREFFTLVRAHLAPGGVFVQWIELSFVDEPLLRTLVATLLDIFPHVRVYRPVFRSGVLFVASDQALPVETTAPRTIAASPDALAWAAVQTEEDVAAALALDEDGTRRFAAGAPLTTDDHNLLQSRSPKILAAPLGADGADRLFAPLDPLPAMSGDLDRLYLVRRLIADQYLERAERFANVLESPVEKLTARGLVAEASGRAADAAGLWREALRRDPGAATARMSLARAERQTLLAGGADAVALTAALTDPAAAVVEGWRRETAADWQGLAALDERLAGARPRDPAYPDALRLRARWRVESAQRARALEALPLLDRLLPLTTDPADRALRTRAAGIVAPRSQSAPPFAG